MTDAEIEELAQRISDLGAGMNLEELLAALGMVVVQVLQQYPPDERMAATVGWTATLSGQMLADWKRSRAN